VAVGRLVEVVDVVVNRTVGRLARAVVLAMNVADQFHFDAATQEQRYVIVYLVKNISSVKVERAAKEPERTLRHASNLHAQQIGIAPREWPVVIHELGNGIAHVVFNGDAALWTRLEYECFALTKIACISCILNLKSPAAPN